jgi:hypothetical protein
VCTASVHTCTGVAGLTPADGPAPQAWGLEQGLMQLFPFDWSPMSHAGALLCTALSPLQDFPGVGWSW